MVSTSHTVITEKQARQITGGRKPLVPVEYESAVKALMECSTLDEAKYWDNKSDALAAWAKIYHNDEALLQAKKLKLHAYRRMGELANEIRPPRSGGGINGRPKGASSLLVESGLTRPQATDALRISRATPKEFSDSMARGMGVTRTAEQFRGRGLNVANISTDDWQWLYKSNGVGAKLSIARSAMRQRAPRVVAAGIATHEIAQARTLVIEIQEWLDEFEQYLPKSSGKGEAQ